MPIVKIFTDGSCLNNQNSKKGQSFGGYGCRIEYPNKIIEEFSAGLSGSKITNNIGEFMAFKRALERMIEVKVKDIVHIYTDSMLLINTYTKWAKIWAKNGWKKSNGKDIENLEMVQDIYTLLSNSNIIIIFKKIKAHLPEPSKSDSSWHNWYGNFRADELAGLCANDMKIDNDKELNKV